MKKRISIILAAVMFISITVVAFALGTTTPTPKEDNPISEWAQESVVKAGENNILESGRNYVYGNPITREEFCELIYNLIHNTSSKGIEIDYALNIDITDTDNAKVLELYAREIINGKTKTEFAPNDTLTREEAATIIARTCDKEIPVPRHELYYEFADKAEISDWAMNGVQNVCNMGVMKGTGDHKFSPKGTFTIEEAITALMRIFDTYKANEALNEGGIVIKSEFDGNVIITDENDVAEIKRILTSYRYTEPPCDGITTHYITFDNEVYSLLKDCKEIKKDGKQAKISDNDLATILKIIEKTQEPVVSTPETSLSFADNLDKQMPKDKNYMFSPMSIKMALALAANGASGETQEQILNALGVASLEEFNGVSKDIIKRYSQADILNLNIANSIWMNKDKTSQNFSDAYKKIATEYYNAEVKSITNPNAVKEINGWVSDKTNGKIPTIIQDANDFWAMLINAIYFKGAWQDEFNVNATKPDQFNNADGTKITVDFMNMQKWFPYAETNSVQMIKLPYQNRVDKISDDGEYLGSDKYDDLDVSMYLIMAENDINVEQELSAVINENAFKSTYIKMAMPKFKIEYSTDLNNILMNMGITTAFDEKNADFTKMFDKGNMWFTKTIHKTFINVDEKGTEVAAVTAIGMAGSSLPPEPIELKFNKPFYFAIRDNTSGETLFVGRFAYAE